MKKIILCSTLIVVVLLTGCMTVDLKSDSVPHPVAMSADINREYEIVGHFEKEIRVWFILFSLFSINQPDVDKLTAIAIENELRRLKGDAVVNLKIQGQQMPFDYLIPVGTAIVGVTLMGSFGAGTGPTIRQTRTVELFASGVPIVDELLFFAGTLISLVGSQIASRTFTLEGDVVRYKN